MTKTNLGLVEHCEKALKEGWYYGWGSYGQKATKQLVNNLVEKYPAMNTRWKSYILKAIDNKNNLCDCYGLVKGYLFLDDKNDMYYNSKYDLNTRMAYDKAVLKGTLDTLPETPGIILYMQGHVGIYTGDGNFIECAGGGVGMRTGVIENGKVAKGSKFSHWFKDANLEYVDNLANKMDIAIEGEVEEMEVVEEARIDKITFILDGEEKQINRIMVDDYNYVNFRDIAELLDYHVDYDPFEKIPELTKKATE